MSHNIGRLITPPAPIGIGPDHGDSSINFQHVSDPVEDTRFLMLHFTGASFPAGNSLVVDLGYGTDVFTSADGSDFWTRPININAFVDKRVPIQYITDGAINGGVQLVEYGRAHRIGEGNRDCTFTNCDLFLHESPYTEPVYDPYWICGAVDEEPCESDPTWKNYNTLPEGYRKQIGRATCMMISAHGENYISTCSATYVGPDLIFLAGHCVSINPTPSPIDLSAVHSASIVFDYQTDEFGNRPGGYAPKIFKVKQAVEYDYTSTKDYVILQIEVPPGGTGITPLSMRTDFPSVGEEVFCIHHPNGAVKKFSPRDADYLTVASVSTTGVNVILDVAGGSSGSGLYDKFGNVVGTLSQGTACNPLKYYSTAHMLKEIGSTPPPPAVDRDVMIVLDRSGSMSGSTFSGGTKIEEAKDAASLFITMIEKGEGHRIGLVSFSNTISKDFDLLANTDENIDMLVGPVAPYSSGIVGDLTTGGSTSIGGGIEEALTEFSGAVDKDEVILLLTDGMENTPPMIDDVVPSIANRRLCIVGYGDETNLNGPLLASLAILNDGSYTVAQDELSLKKFFAACFGEVFEAGFLMDPDFFLPKNQEVAKPLSFHICGEEAVTIVIGWDNMEGNLLFKVETPLGNEVLLSDENVESTFGRSWRFMRIKLPYQAERDGEWKITVFRPVGTGEFPPPSFDLNYFINVIAKGGPTLKRLSRKKRFYTGDVINPLVRLHYPNNTSPGHAHVKVTVTKPMESVGNILTENGLDEPTQNSGDTIPSIYATLDKLSTDANKRLITYEKETFDLYDDGAHEDGAMEEDGIFGNPLTDLFKHSGVYTFQAKAHFGEVCEASREVVWSLYVDTKIDENNTTIDGTQIGNTPSGKQKWKFTITPKDAYGNYVGPGRLDGFTVTGAYGNEVTGSVTDNGDGTYEVETEFDPDSGGDPGVVINQPDAAPAVFCKPKKGDHGTKIPWWIWFILLMLLLIIILLLIYR